jgi:hypothetical protein
VLRLDVPFAKSSCSTNNTLYPRAAASTATPRPVAPPPITRKSQDFVFSIRSIAFSLLIGAYSKFTVLPAVYFPRSHNITQDRRCVSFYRDCTLCQIKLHICANLGDTVSRGSSIRGLLDVFRRAAIRAHRRFAREGHSPGMRGAAAPGRRSRGEWIRLRWCRQRGAVDRRCTWYESWE